MAAVDYARVVGAALGSALGVKRASSAPPGAPGGAFGGSTGGGTHQMLQFKKWSLDKAISDGYEINEWVHACVNAIGRHAASVPWRVSEFSSSEAKARFMWELKGVPASQRNDFFKDAHRAHRVAGHGVERKAAMIPRPNDPLEQLLEQPNPYMTRQEFIERMSQFMLLGGNAPWVKLRGKRLGVPGVNTPLELWPLFPQAVQVDSDGMVPKKYHYYPDGRGGEARDASASHYDPKDVIHHRLPSPSDPIWGISPLMAAAKAVDTDVMSARWQLTSFNNRAIPDILVSFDAELSPDQYRRARTQVAEQHQGTQNSRAPWVLGNQAAVRQLSLTPVEMDFIRSRAANRQSICSIFNVFPLVIAVMEGISLSQVEVILKHHWIQTVIPFLDRAMGEINLSLTPDFGGNRYAWFDTSNVDALTEALIERVRAQKILHTQGVPISVLNNRFELNLDLEGVPLIDEPVYPAGVITGTQLAAGENLAGNQSGSGNTNTPPEGGPISDPGNPQDPNQAPPEDVVPGDPGANPDTVLGEDPELQRLASGYFENGHADPHEGKTRWTYEGALDYLRDEARASVDLQASLKDDDTWMFLGVVLPQEINLPDGVELLDYAGKAANVSFYHGEATQERRDKLLARVKSWGYSV